MFQITGRIKEKLILHAKILIDEDSDSAELMVTKKITITLIKVSKAQKAYEQGLVLTDPIEMYGEEFLVLRGPIVNTKP